MTTKYDNELQTAYSAAMDAGRLIMDMYGQDNNTRSKADGTPVTDADVKSNELLVARIKQAYPLDSIISEEEDAVQASENRRWHIDPIDGTSGYTARTGEFAVHVGLEVEGTPVLGVIYQPTRRRLWWGVSEGNTYTSSPDRPRIASVQGKKEAQLLHATIGAEQKVISGSEGLRMMKIADGHATYRLGNTTGRANSWDLVAPHAILRSRGMVLTDLEGKNLDYTAPLPPVLAAADLQTHREILGRLRVTGALDKFS